MINFSYKHISKIIELVDYEMDKLQRQKERSGISPAGSLVEDVLEQQYEDDKKRIDGEIRNLQEIKDKFLEVLNRVTFTFNTDRISGVSDKSDMPSGPVSSVFK